MLPKPEDVAAAQDALLNILKIDPNLMFRAIIGVNNRILSDYMEDIVMGGINERRRNALKLRMVLCQVMGTALLNSGRINLSPDETTKVAEFLKVMQQDDDKKTPSNTGAYWT